MKSTYLATTGNTDVWDLNVELLLLGAWCVAQKPAQDLLKNRSYRILPYPWEPRSKLPQAGQYTYRIYDAVIAQLAPRLNALHGVSYPLQSWRILLAPWLLHLVCIAYDRYLRLQNALQVSPDFVTHVLPENQCDLTASTTSDFFAVKMQRDDYNLKLISVIARHVCPKNTVEKNITIAASKDLMVENSQWALTKLKNRLKEIVCRWNASSTGEIVLSDMYHLSLWDELKLNWKMGGALRFVHFEYLKEEKNCETGAYSPSIRKSLGNVESSDDFTSLVYQLIPLTIPSCYVEDFGRYRAKAQKVMGSRSVQCVGSAIGWSYNEDVKFLAAEAVSKNALSVEFQHGGGYGLHEATTCEQLSFENDLFFSWGWKYGKTEKIRILPSPHLSKLSYTHRPVLDKILFAGVFMLTYDNRLMSWLLCGDKEKYFQDKKMFFKNLKENLQQNHFLYRPYVFMNWGEVEWMRELRQDMPMAERGSLTDWMKKSKVVVIDHPHTSFLEALAIDVPTVLYWDHDVYRMTKESEPYFDLLREAGILYKTPQQAAEHVNAIYDNPKKWWESDRVQGARREFCQRYAYAKKDWTDDWVRDLKKLRGQKETRLPVVKETQDVMYEYKH